MVEIAGRSYQIERIHAREAFELECILLGGLGPAASVSLGAVIEPALDLVAGAVRRHLLTPAAGEGEDAPAFDLARVATLLDVLETTAPTVRAVAEAILDALAPSVGRALDTAAPQLLEALGWDRVRRMVELAVLGSVFVVVDGQPRRIADWKGLDAATGKAWSTKWLLLLESLRSHFAADDQGAEG